MSSMRGTGNRKGAGTSEGKGSARLAARRAATDAQAKIRRRQAAREKRLAGLAVEVIAALAERDRLAAIYEERAGEALPRMTEVEGLSVADAVEWCACAVTSSEARRLRRLVNSTGLRSGEVHGDDDTVQDSVQDTLHEAGATDTAGAEGAVDGRAAADGAVVDETAGTGIRPEQGRAGRGT